MATAAEKAAQKVKEIEEQLKQARLKAQKAMAAAKARENQAARTERERKKYLVGALVLEEMEKNGTFNQHMLQKLASFLTRPNDRALFGLTAHPNDATTEQQSNETTS